MNTKRAVCGLVFHNNKILSVSRKSNHNDFNLFGGKLESGETWEKALIREAYEETGCSIKIIPIYYEAMCGDTLVRTYICVATESSLELDYLSLDYPEKGMHIVKYLSPSELTEGSFGDYNSKLFKHFNITDEEKT